MKPLYYISTLFVLILLSSCGVKKHLPSNQYLLKSSSLNIVAADSVNKSNIQREAAIVLNEQATPRWRVWWHYRDGFLLRWLGKRIGRAPIFYDSRKSQTTLQLLENRAINTGHFYNLAAFQTDTSHQQQAISVNYELKVGAAYSIDSIRYEIRDPHLAYLIDSLSKNTVLKLGSPYELEALKAERERLEAALRKQAYYYFSAADLEFLADTIGNDGGVQLLLKLRDELPTTHTQQQAIRHIRILGNYQNQNNSTAALDSTLYEEILIICKDCPLRNEVLAEAIDFRSGTPYSPQSHDETVERLASFNMFRYISINYQPVSGIDSLLDLTIYLTPDLRRSISGEVGAAYNSGGYFGPELGFTYSNRNLFEGAELFTLDGDFTYNFYLGPANEGQIPKSGIFGMNAAIAIPRFWLPTRKNILQNFLQAHTNISVGGKVETLSLQLSRFAEEITDNDFTTLAQKLADNPDATEGVNLWQISANYGYSWKKNPRISNTLTLFRIRYQNPRVSTEELLSLSRSLGFTQGLSGLGRLDRMFLIGPQFTWILDSRLVKRQAGTRKPRQHHFFSKISLGLGFNTILPIGTNQRELSTEKSNYIQPELDFRYYWQINRQLVFAARVHGGVAVPLTERAIVPYFDLYTVGGPNSLRGFVPRGLGPGLTVASNNNLLGQNGYGNVLFESSLEFRYKLSSFFELAAFGDFGNVWLYKTETEPTMGDFDFKRFPNELAIDAGIGLRIDLTFLVIRLDVAKPISIPFENNPEVTVNKKSRFVIGFGQAF